MVSDLPARDSIPAHGKLPQILAKQFANKIGNQNRAGVDDELGILGARLMTCYGLETDLTPTLGVFSRPILPQP